MVKVINYSYNWKRKLSRPLQGHQAVSNLNCDMVFNNYRIQLLWFICGLQTPHSECIYKYGCLNFLIFFALRKKMAILKHNQDWTLKRNTGTPETKVDKTLYLLIFYHSLDYYYYYYLKPLTFSSKTVLYGKSWNSHYLPQRLEQLPSKINN